MVLTVGTAAHCVSLLHTWFVEALKERHHHGGLYRAPTGSPHGFGLAPDFALFPPAIGHRPRLTVRARAKNREVGRSAIAFALTRGGGGALANSDFPRRVGEFARPPATFTTRRKKRTASLGRVPPDQKTCYNKLAPYSAEGSDFEASPDYRNGSSPDRLPFSLLRHPAAENNADDPQGGRSWG